MIEVRNLSVTLANRAILRKISFSLSDGEFLAVLGPNGGGKSTLIRAILGLQDYAGTIKYAGGGETRSDMCRRSRPSIGLSRRGQKSWSRLPSRNVGRGQLTSIVREWYRMPFGRLVRIT